MGTEHSGWTRAGERPSWDYDAFVSYRGEHAERTARLIRTALLNLGKRHRPQWERRIFVDRLALKVGDIDARAVEPLVASRTLVVVLDGDTANSLWVDEEIETWLWTTGATDRLFLISCSRDLNLTWVNGRFAREDQVPPALHMAFDREPRVFDVSMDGKRTDRAMLGLYAAISGIDPDELENDERRFQRRQHRWWGTVQIVVFGCLAILCGLLAVLAG